MSKEEFKVSNMFIDSLKTQQELYYKAKIEKIYQQKLKDLQQKVEQLEKENEKLKYLADDSNTTKAFIVEHNKVEQLENIRKEAIDYMKDFIFEPLLINEDRKLIMYNENLKNFENILNKGSESNV